VNATPVGMQGGPDPDGNPLESLAEAAGGTPPFESIGETVVMDTVYAPTWTPLLREAKSRGARCVTGDAMFERQAVRQSERWIGGAR
jgi:shikimate 5-dehydrogenase